MIFEEMDLDEAIINTKLAINDFRHEYGKLTLCRSLDALVNQVERYKEKFGALPKDDDSPEADS